MSEVQTSPAPNYHRRRQTCSSERKKEKKKQKHPETNIKHNSNTTLTPGSTVSSGVTVFESICSTNDKKTKVSFSDLSQKRSREDGNVSITVS